MGKKKDDDRPEIPGGYILLSRTLMEHPVWGKDLHHFRLWLYLLMEARWEKEPKMIGDVVVERGQVLRAYRTIAEDCRWIENQRVRRWSLSKLNRMVAWFEARGCIYTKTTTLGTLFTIRNYPKYQDASRYKKGDPGTDLGTGSEHLKEGEEVYLEEEHPDGSGPFLVLSKALGEEHEPVVRKAVMLGGMDRAEAEWLVRHFLDEPGGEFGDYWDSPYRDEIARALGDMHRKRRAWGRTTFVHFLTYVYGLEYGCPSGNPKDLEAILPELALELFLDPAEAFDVDEGERDAAVFDKIVAVLDGRGAT